MSARVFSRFTMSDARVPRGSPPGQEVERVRRALFPPHNFAQTRQFAAEELANIQKQKSEHYEFDFESGQPFDSAKTRRFKWEKVESTESVPEAYEFKRLPYLRTHAEQPEEATPAPSGTEEVPAERSRQTSITDYLQKRKSAPSCGSSKSVSCSSDGASFDSTAVAEPSAKKQKFEGRELKRASADVIETSLKGVDIT